ncbi:MAG: 4-vinyl reductase [Betaproteobacteria bacterium]|nr:4-vinyl reductase [Betaproteobacteria bacterium]
MPRPAPSLADRLRHDLEQGQILDQDRRYLMLRADVLMGLFAELEPAARAPALRALGRSVRRHGAGSVQAYARLLAEHHGASEVSAAPAWAATAPSPAAQALPGDMARAAAALGWGVWEFEPDGQGLRLTVRNSPFAAAARGLGLHGEPVCQAIAGMAAALGQALWSVPADVNECCAAQGPPGEPLRCVFQLRPRGRDRGCGTNHLEETEP